MCRSLAFIERSREQYGRAKIQAEKAEVACTTMRVDLARSSKEREAAINAKVAAEEKLKEVTREWDDMGRKIPQMKKDLELRDKKVKECMDKMTELEDRCRRLEAEVHDHPVTVKLLVAYMRNNPVGETEDLSIKDLAAYGVDFSFLPQVPTFIILRSSSGC